MRPPPQPNEFERLVAATDKSFLIKIKTRLLASYTSKLPGNSDLLLKAINLLDTDPRWFRNVNPIYSDVIADIIKGIIK